jgi:hypothetical protein
LDRGVDNLSDLGVEKNYERSSTYPQYEFYNGQLIRKDDEGGGDWIFNWDAPEGSPNIIRVPPDAKRIPGTASGTFDNDGNEGFRPLNEDELKTYDQKTGEFEKLSGKKLIDKSTGKVIAKNKGAFGGLLNNTMLGQLGADTNQTNFVLDSYETGNFFKGKSKQMGIMMTEQGIPVPYQTTEKEGLVYSPVMPILLAALAPGVASAISGSLPGAAVAATGAAEGAFLAGSAPTLMNTALTQGIMGGGTALLTDQDPLKGALLGAVGAPISAGIGSLLPAGLDANAANAIKGAGTGVVKGLIQGGDFEDLLGQGVLGGLANYGFGEASKGFGNTFNLTPEQLNLFSGIASPLIQGKNVNFMDLIGPLAKYGQQQTTKVPT